MPQRAKGTIVTEDELEGRTPQVSGPRTVAPIGGTNVPGTERTGLPGIVEPPNPIVQRAKELDEAQRTVDRIFPQDTRGFGQSFKAQLNTLNPWNIVSGFKEYLNRDSRDVGGRLGMPEGQVADIPSTAQTAIPVGIAARQAYQGNIPGAIGTATGSVVPALAGSQLTREGRAVARDAATGAARDVAETASKIDLRRPLSIIKADPAAAIGAVPGYFAGHYLGRGYRGGAMGATAGAVVPSAVRGAYRAVKAGREARKAGPMRFEQFPETPPLPPTQFEEFPQPPPITPEAPITYEQFPQYRSEELPPTRYEQFRTEQAPPEPPMVFENLNPESAVPDLRAQQLTDALKRVAERKKKSQ